jgi:CheY-like chemotaxis protein
MATTTVLYVEDEPDDAYFMRSAFKRAGVPAQFEVVEDGLAAISYLTGDKPYENRERHPLPALMLLDLNLPGLSGFEVLEWLRHQEHLRALPVVVFSSSGRPEDQSRARELGANDYVIKPNSGNHFADLARKLHATWLMHPATGTA